MKLTLDENDAGFIIRGYDEGIIRINDQSYNQSLIVSPERLIENWPPGDLAELEGSHFVAAMDLEPEILILGTGTRYQYPDTALMSELFRYRIGIEVMDTPAACRTYNLLSSEGRAVVACILIR